MPLVEHDYAVEALAANRGDEPFHERVLPGTPGRTSHLLVALAFDAALKVLAVDAVSVAHQEPWAMSNGKASITCCAVHSAERLVVTWKCGLLKDVRFSVI